MSDAPDPARDVGGDGPRDARSGWSRLESATIRPSADELARAVGGVLAGDWLVAPLGGSNARTFVATGPRSAVVRLDTSPAILERLAAIQVAPRVLGAGRVGPHPFVVQAHVQGPPVDGGWIADHAADVARLVARYAADGPLAALAEPLRVDDCLADLARRAASVRVGEPVGTAIERLARQAATLQPAVLVASHGDPNASNFLVEEGRPLLIDWDDLRRADPMRDLGQLAWWYLPQHGWPGFMDAAGVRWDAAAEDRLYWWVAAESLDVALRLLADHSAAADDFLADAAAAIDRRPNPRGG